MEDDNSMSERILRTLETILNNDPELKEFSIVPAESNAKNKCPVLYEEHNVALESWCVKHIYRYAYLELFEARGLLAKRKLSFCKEHNLNHLLMGVLLVNPDVSTFWNMKRELVENDVLSINGELLFTKMVLSYKSKSNEAFGHRRWLLNRVLGKVQEHELENLLRNELNVCEMTAGKNSNNYHSWTHRIWCLETMGCRVGNFRNVVVRELEFSQRWLTEHVSEHTGYHYRQYLINTVKKCRNVNHLFEYYYKYVVVTLGLVNENDPRDILTFLLGKDKAHVRPIEETNNYLNFMCLLLFDLYNTVEVLSSVYPNHESIWYHRRYLMYQLIKAAYDYHGLAFKMGGKVCDVPLYGTNIVNMGCDGEKEPKLFKSEPNKVESTPLYQILVKTESDFVKKNSQSTNFHEIELAKRYEKWLKLVLGIGDL